MSVERVRLLLDSSVSASASSAGQGYLSENPVAGRPRVAAEESLVFRPLLQIIGASGQRSKPDLKEVSRSAISDGDDLKGRPILVFLLLLDAFVLFGEVTVSVPIHIEDISVQHQPDPCFGLRT